MDLEPNLTGITMAAVVDKSPPAARLLAVAAAGDLPTTNYGTKTPTPLAGARPALSPRSSHNSSIWCRAGAVDPIGSDLPDDLASREGECQHSFFNKMKTPGSCFEREELIITLNRQDTLNHAGALRGNPEELLR